MDCSLAHPDLDLRVLDVDIPDGHHAVATLVLSQQSHHFDHVVLGQVGPILLIEDAQGHALCCRQSRAGSVLLLSQHTALGQRSCRRVCKHAGACGTKAASPSLGFVRCKHWLLHPSVQLLIAFVMDSCRTESLACMKS